MEGRECELRMVWGLFLHRLMDLQELLDRISECVWFGLLEIIQGAPQTTLANEFERGAT